MAHHDQSHYFRTSMAPGLLFPIACFPVVPGDDVRISYESLINTQALLSPLYGSYKLQIDSFFVPDRLYIPKLWRNGSISKDGKPMQFGFPTLSGADVSVNESSLLAYLGCAPYQWLSYDGSSDPVTLNAIPALGMLDIWRCYYANRQESTFPVINPRTQSAYLNFKLSTVDAIFDSLPFDGGDLLAVFRSAGSDGNAFFDWLFGSFTLCGLLPRCYLPDKMNVILNESFLQQNVSSVQVNVANGAFQVDQLVTAKKLWQARNHDAMTNHTFKDWVRMHYGVTPKIMDDMPTFLGSTSSDVVFEDIRATATTDSSILGDKASSGKGYLNSRVHRCVADCPGFFFGIASLVPRVDYYQGAERFTMWKGSQDYFLPEYNGVGYQDVLVSDLCASSLNGNGSGAGSGQNPYQSSVGKQPAWIEYMTAVNKVRGTFCTTEKSWVLSRDMTSGSGLDSPDPVSEVNPSAYVLPFEWNQPFAVQAKDAQNFLAQFFIRDHKRSTVLKRLMPYF
ncbi:major capsid protein [Dipodfec virus UOA04_Rod_720]|nr:major capsid protein [Dipodfec virus UOA04_Rod_720]